MAQRLTLASAVAVVVAGLFFILYGYWISERARFMLRTAKELSEQSTQPTLDQIRQRFGAGLPFDECGDNACTYKVKVSNHILAALHLVPYTELQSNFRVRNGLVYENLLDYMTTVSGRRDITAHASVRFGDGCVFSLDPWQDSSPTNSNGLVGIAAECPGPDRVAVLNLNVDCLTKPGGCKSIADLIPTMWEHNPDGTIRCRIPTCEGFVHPPAAWTWMKWKGDCHVIANSVYSLPNVTTRH